MRVTALACVGSFILEQVFILTCVVTIFGTCTFLPADEALQRGQGVRGGGGSFVGGGGRNRRNFYDNNFEEDLASKYYINKKGSQVVEIGSNKECHVYDGADAEWLKQLKSDRMEELNFFQFRLMVGKCRIEAFLKPLGNEWKRGRNSANYTTTNKPQPTEREARESTSIGYNKHSTDRFGPASNLTEYSQDAEEEEEEELFFNATPSSEAQQPPLVYPGTLWCGRGSVAKRAADLGHYTETDKCCREHDQCQESMESRTCKYGICNYSDYTRSHCTCDERFRFCLQQDRSFSSFASFKIANLYFNILKPMCYDRRPPVKFCRKHRITGECIDFEYEPAFPSIWQFFPAQPYPTVLDAVEKFMSSGSTTSDESAEVRKQEVPPPPPPPQEPPILTYHRKDDRGTGGKVYFPTDDRQQKLNSADNNDADNKMDTDIKTSTEISVSTSFMTITSTTSL